MAGLSELKPQVGVRLACEGLGLARSTAYRWLSPRRRASLDGRRRARSSPRALSETEREAVLELLHSERFVDQAPASVYAQMLDEGRYLCSVRTMYRILQAHGEVRERRNQRRHPHYQRPELLASGPNQLWSWDITELRGPHKGMSYPLYVLLDVFSRLVVAWLLAHRENGVLAAKMIREAGLRQGVEADQLTVHADRGPAPASKPVAELLTDLGIEKSHSRPRVSNDNPYSESQFRTLKYRPGYPNRFAGYEHALAWCREFFPWYNYEHRHSGIAYLTPADVHYGRAAAILQARRATMQAAYDSHPERFVSGSPLIATLPEAVYINPPEDKSKSVIETH